MKPFEGVSGDSMGLYSLSGNLQGNFGDISRCFKAFQGISGRFSFVAFRDLHMPLGQLPSEGFQRCFKAVQVVAKEFPKVLGVLWVFRMRFKVVSEGFHKGFYTSHVSAGVNAFIGFQ